MSITVTRKQPAFILRLNQVSLSQGNSQRSSCDSINSLSQGNSQRSSCGSIKYHCHKETASVHLVVQSIHCHKETASVHLAAQSSITVTRKQPAFILRLNQLNQVSLPQGNSQRDCPEVAVPVSILLLWTNQFK